MGQMSREQFLAREQEKGDRQFSKVGYFSLKNDNDEAIVRFVYQTEEEIYQDIITTHKMTVDGKFRRVNCIREFNEPLAKCPLCAAGIDLQPRLYIRLVEYVRAEDGTITAVPKVWERPTSYVNTLRDKFAEYGNLSDFIFKVRRHGRPGDMKTTYSIDFANPNIYNSSLYIKDFSEFEDYKVIGAAVLNKTYDELVGMVNGGVPVVTTPPSNPPVQQPATQPDTAPWASPQNTVATPTTPPRRVVY